MKIDGPKYRNPVVLNDKVYADAYTSMLSSLPEYRYANRIVGFTDEALFACSKRNAKSGYYEMICEPVRWSEVSSVTYRRSFSFGSVFLGFIFIVIGAAIFYAGWIAKTHTGLAVFWMPIACPIAGLMLIVGARRLRLEVKLGKRILWWVASPLFKHEAELLDRLSQVPELKINEDDG